MTPQESKKPYKQQEIGVDLLIKQKAKSFAFTYQNSADPTRVTK